MCSDYNNSKEKIQKQLMQMYIPCFDSVVKIKDLKEQIFAVVPKISDKELGKLVRKIFPDVQKVCTNSVSYYRHIKRMTVTAEDVNKATQTEASEFGTTDKMTQVHLYELPPCMYLSNEMVRQRPKKHIGTGVSAQTFIGFYNDTKVCIKQFHAGIKFDEVKHEAKMMSCLPSHRCLPTLIGLIDKEPFSLVLSFFCQTEQPLRNTLRYFYQIDSLSLMDRFKVAVDIVETVSYIHKYNIIHCDLNADNILIKLTPSLQVKIIDFGLAEMVLSERSYTGMNEDDSVLRKMKLHPHVAPEIHCNYHCSYRTDYFGVGYCLGIIFKKSVEFNRDFDHVHQLIRKCRMFHPDKRTDLDSLHTILKEVLKSICRLKK